MKNFVVITVCFLFGTLFVPTNSQNQANTTDISTTEVPESRCANFSTSCADCVNNNCTYESGTTKIKACKDEGEPHGDVGGVVIATNLTECEKFDDDNSTTEIPILTTIQPANETNSTTTSTTPPSSTTTSTEPTTVTTEKPISPTDPTTSTSSSTPSTTTVPSEGPTAEPSHDRRFDAPSFIGGIVLTLGTMAIGFVAFKFYKARTERNYHTL